MTHKKPYTARYKDGFTLREHNKSTSLIAYDWGYMIQICRVVREGELGADFQDSGHQQVYRKAGISVLVSRMRMSHEGLLSLGQIIGVAFREEASITFTYSPEND
jgi:hypothetical protein